MIDSDELTTEEVVAEIYDELLMGHLENLPFLKEEVAECIKNNLS